FTLSDRGCGKKWRPEPESNRRARICSPLRNHSAIGPPERDALWRGHPPPVNPPPPVARAFDEWRLASPTRADKSQLDLQVYYWHITVMTIQRPIPDFAAAREAMIESQLRPQGVTDPAVLDAMRRIPRENFLPSHTRPLAYVDRAVAIGEGRFLAAPAVLGQLLTQMMPEVGQRALVVGAGTAYSAAILLAMGLDVVALVRDSGLAAAALHAGIKVTEEPLEQGHAAGAPYDQILIDGAVEYIPDAIVAQLADGG